MKKTIITSIIFLITFISNTAIAGLQPKELFADDVVSNIKLSPDGKYLAYSIPKGNSEIVSIIDTATNKATYSFTMGENRFVAQWYWANNERLLIKPGRKSGRSETLYYTGKLQAINFDGSKNKQLWGYNGRFGSGEKDNFKDPFNIESLMRDDPEHIMISSFPTAESTRRLKLINIYSGRVINRELSSTRKARFIIDAKGNAIAQIGILKSWEDEILYKNKENDWVEFENARNYDLISDYDDKSILMSHYVGKNQTELVQFNRHTSESTVIATMNDIQATSLLWSWDNKVIAYRTDSGKPKMNFLDPKSDRAVFNQLLLNSFKGKYVSELQRSRDNNIRLVYVSSDTEPGIYYLYNNTKKKLAPLIKRRPSLDRKLLSPMRPISFTARDGMTINGYLTSPIIGQSPQPMVVMVHGGPFGPRDYWGYNAEAQLLASHGYLVLQVNFRGSGGYGLSFEKAGYKQWGKAMQDDITDGTLWAIENEVADKDNICIYGASYGGYAALMGAVKEPDLYQCAIGYAGVYDLPLKYKKGDIRERQEGVSFIEQTVGTDLNELKKYSPAYHVDKIKAALLLVHGEHDKRVPIEHYESLASALDKINYPYEAIIKKEEVHGFYNNENKIELYGHMLKFLAKHLNHNVTASTN